MIGRIRGTLLSKQPPWLLVDCHGVGYEMEAPMTTFYNLPSAGQEVSLHTHLVVREDAQLLYAFGSEQERQMFRTLIKVNGVGAKMALTILSGISATAFARCVQDNDTATLVKLPGVGKKTAERLIVEMRDRISDWGEGLDIRVLPQTGGTAGAAAGSAERDALGALLALGYKPQEASRMISAVADLESLASEEIIRLALKGVMK